MKNKSFGVAIIGCGRIANHHMNSVILNKNFKLISVCDLDDLKGSHFSTKYNIPFYKDYREMLTIESNIDLVVIATPSGMHFEHSLEVLKDFNKNIIVEKPTFMKLTEAKIIFDLASKKKLKVYPVFQNRFNSAVMRVKKAIESGELGEIRVSAVRVRWCRPQRYYDMSNWRGTFSHDGGAITNQGIHHVDLLRYFCGEIEEVNCSMATLGSIIEVEDTVVASYKHKSGALGTLEITTAARPDDYEASISLVCSKGIAQIGGVAVNKLEILSTSEKDCSNFSENFEELEGTSKVYGNGHKYIYEKIYDDLILKEYYKPDEEDCINTLKLLHSFYVSNEKKSIIKVKDGLESEYLGRKDESISKLYRV